MDSDNNISAPSKDIRQMNSQENNSNNNETIYPVGTARYIVYSYEERISSHSGDLDSASYTTPQTTTQ